MKKRCRIMKKLTVVIMSICLLALLSSGAYAADIAPAPKDAELEAGDWTTLARRYPMSYLASGGEVPEAPSPEILANWWDTLGDETLTRLINLSLENNRDLISARAKFRESRAALGISKSAVLPWLDSSNTLTRSKTGKNGSSTGNEIGPVDFYSLGIDASWEIDIFGGQAQKIKARKADLQAEYGALHNAWVTLSSEVALNYASFRTLQKRLLVAENNLALQMETVELLQSQYDSGLKDGLALSQAKYTMEQTRSTVPPLRTNIEETMNRLAILVGQVPGSLEEMLGEYSPLPKPEATDLVGIPANSLRQRPDIYSAERRLAAQIASKEAAQRDLWPKFYLFGSIGLESFTTGGLSIPDGVSYGFGPSISWPIFHGGAIRNNIKVQTAKQEQMLAAYEQTVLNAVAEVRNALTSETQERERNQSLQRGVDAARTAHEIAEDKYKNGLTDFNNVIGAQRALLTFEEQYAISEGQMLSNIVRVFKVLGGGWAPLTEGDLSQPVEVHAAKARETRISSESQRYLEQIRQELKSTGEM
jgi:NodT family efflux transporter outer membrane factor (OMF) lipoprotein